MNMEKSGIFVWLSCIFGYFVGVGVASVMGVFFGFIGWVISSDSGSFQLWSSLVYAFIKMNSLGMMGVGVISMGLLVILFVTAIHVIVSIILDSLDCKVTRPDVFQNFSIGQLILVVIVSVVISIFVIGVVSLVDFWSGKYYAIWIYDGFMYDDPDDLLNRFLFQYYNFSRLAFFVCAIYFYCFIFSKKARGNRFEKGWPAGIRLSLFLMGSIFLGLAI